MIRKSYASQESVEGTLTAADRAAPFRVAEPDGEPLPAVTRTPVVVDGQTLATIDPHTGETIHVVVIREAAE